MVNDSNAMDIKPILLCGLTWEQALNSLRAVDCGLRRPGWCSPIVILKDGHPVIDDDGEILPMKLMAGERHARDWQMCPRFDDDGEKVEPDYRQSNASAIEARSDATPKSDAAEGESATRQGDAQ